MSEVTSESNIFAPTTRAPTPLPKMKFFVLACVLISESFSINMLFPFIAFMVNDFGIAETEKEVGYYAGLIASSFNVAQLLSRHITDIQSCVTFSVWWGTLSDRYGRRPILLIGLCGNIFSVAAFGFSKYLWWAMLFRCLNGLLNVEGNSGVAKTYIKEITDVTNEAKGFSIISLVWGMGSIGGPAIGGLLSQPSLKYPSIFPPGSFFDHHPYALPCIVSASFSFVGFLTGLFFLKETLGQKHEIEIVELKETQEKEEDENVEEEKLLSEEEIFDETVLEVATEEIPLRDEDPVRAPLCGCFNKSYAKLGNSNKPSTWSLFKEKDVVAAVILYGILSFVFIILEETFALWVINPAGQGGLGFDTQDIGISLIINGVFVIIYQTFIHHRISNRIGALQTFRFGAVLATIVFFLYPWAGSLARPNVEFDPRVWGYIILVGAARIVASGALFSSSFLLIANSTTHDKTGAANGLGQSAGSLARAVGPSLGGAMFAWSNTNGLPFPLDYHFVFMFISLCAAGMSIYSFRVSPDIARRK